MEEDLPNMDPRLLTAATDGAAETVGTFGLDMLLRGRTAQGSTCLHIACIYGHKNFCEAVLNRPEGQSTELLSVTNKDGETPLLTALISGHVELAVYLLESYRDHRLQNYVLIQGKDGNNVLHHAIRGEHKALAQSLIGEAPEPAFPNLAFPALSHAMNENKESPMFIAVLKGFVDVVGELLKIPESAHSGPAGYNALHAAVKYGIKEIVYEIMERRPRLAREEDNKFNTPMHLAAHFNGVNVLKVMLGKDSSLGYAISTEGNPLLVIAAIRGYVDFARELLRICPDAPYRNYINGQTCLHEAVVKNQMKFVEFILWDTKAQNPRLRNIINMQDNNGDSALHLAVKNCNSKMVSALLSRRDKTSCKMDVALINSEGSSAVWMLSEIKDYAKTLSWHTISNLIYYVDGRAKNDIHNLHVEVLNKVTEKTREEAKNLFETYTEKTSIVAILIASVTFAAPFQLPGGYSSATGSGEELPTMARKHAYALYAFLISDTLAMVSSLAVAFICVITRLTDIEFLVTYRNVTRKLMWFAYMATVVAFATGLYPVLVPRLHGWAIAVCVISALSPILPVVLFFKWSMLGFVLGLKNFVSWLKSYVSWPERFMLWLRRFALGLRSFMLELKSSPNNDPRIELLKLV